MSTTGLQKWRQSVDLSSKRPRPKDPWCALCLGSERSKMGSTRMFLQAAPQVVLMYVLTQSPYLQHIIYPLRISVLQQEAAFEQKADILAQRPAMV